MQSATMPLMETCGIYADGSFEIVYEDEVTAQELIDKGVVNLLAFGPSSVEDGEIVGTVHATQVGLSNGLQPVTSAYWNH